MNIIVCVKAVPHVIGSVRLQTDCKDIVRDEFSYKINDTDDNALEEALLLRERGGGERTALTLSSPEGQEDCRQILRECLAKGVDEAVLLTDVMFKELDSYTIAKLLAEVIRTMPHDLVLTGSQSLDGNRGEVGPMLATFMDLPYATLAVKIEVAAGKLTVETELDEGFRQVVCLTLPGLVTVQSGINEPRYASLSRIRMARDKPIRQLDAKDLDASAELIAQWRKVTTATLAVAEKKQTEYIQGTTDEVAAKLVEIINKLRRGT